MARPREKRFAITAETLRVPFLPRWLRIVFLVLLVILLIPYVVAPFYRFGEPVSTVMLWRQFTGEPVTRIYRPLSNISPDLPPAVLVAEDARFCSHMGIDLRQIREAISDADDFDDLRGGSTITQQVAKNLFLWPGRSLVRKVLEFPLALWIDLVLPKWRILEIYLNVAEWGPAGFQQVVPRPHRPRIRPHGGDPAQPL
jgi:monofunctional biosynthetic peptidoglycan transglycosylase